MINIRNLKALSDMSLEYLVVNWEIDDTTESLRNYRYDIYRCIGADNENEYEFLDSVSGDSFHFYDTTALQYKRGIHFYYIVVPVYILSDTTGEPKKCVSLYDKKRDTYANYMRHVNNVYLNVVGNKAGYILTKRRFGQKCSKCWDDIRRQHRHHSCPNCFGTGYEGGYHTPYSIKFNYLTPPPGAFENTGMDGRGDNMQDVSIWTESYPIISVGDRFVAEKNERLKGVQVQRTMKNNEFMLRQILNMQLLSTADPAYGVIIEAGGESDE